MIELGKKWLTRNTRMEAKISRCVVRALKYNFVNSMLAFVTFFYLFILLSDESKLQQIWLGAFTRHALSKVTQKRGLACDYSRTVTKPPAKQQNRLLFTWSYVQFLASWPSNTLRKCVLWKAFLIRVIRQDRKTSPETQERRISHAQVYYISFLYNKLGSGDFFLVFLSRPFHGYSTFGRYQLGPKIFRLRWKERL